MTRGLTSSFLFLFFVLTMVSSFSSCCRKRASIQIQNEEFSDSQIQHKDSSKDFENYKWDNLYAIEVINGLSIDKEEYKEGLPRLELQIQQGRLIGFTGCNSFQAQARLTQNEDEIVQIEIGPIMSTKKGCIEEINEQHFFQALESSSSLLLSNNRIFLINEEGVIVIQGYIVD